MNKIQKISFLLLFLSSVSFISCDDNSNSSNTTATPSPGTWKVVYFFDKQDETSHFSGYVFDFGSNGSLSASKDGQTWNGTWVTGVDDSKNKLVIAFSASIPSALEELQEDWLIIKMEDSFMHLEHTSGGNGDTDIVHFEKAEAEAAHKRLSQNVKDHKTYHLMPNLIHLYGWNFPKIWSFREVPTMKTKLFFSTISWSRKTMGQ